MCRHVTFPTHKIKRAGLELGAALTFPCGVQVRAPTLKAVQTPKLTKAHVSSPLSKSGQATHSVFETQSQEVGFTYTGTEGQRVQDGADGAAGASEVAKRSEGLHRTCLWLVAFKVLGAVSPQILNFL